MRAFIPISLAILLWSANTYAAESLDTAFAGMPISAPADWQVEDVKRIEEGGAKSTVVSVAWPDSSFLDPAKISLVVSHYDGGELTEDPLSLISLVSMCDFDSDSPLALTEVNGHKAIVGEYTGTLGAEQAGINVRLTQFASAVFLSNHEAVAIYATASVDSFQKRSNAVRDVFATIGADRTPEAVELVMPTPNVITHKLDKKVTVQLDDDWENKGATKSMFFSTLAAFSRPTASGGSDTSKVFLAPKLAQMSSTTMVDSLRQGVEAGAPSAKATCVPYSKTINGNKWLVHGMESTVVVEGRDTPIYYVLGGAEVKKVGTLGYMGATTNPGSLYELYQILETIAR